MISKLLMWTGWRSWIVFFEIKNGEMTGVLKSIKYKNRKKRFCQEPRIIE